MTLMERNALIIKALLQMAQNFGGTMPETLLEKWIELLAPYAVQDILAAIDDVMLTYAFKTMPPIAEIIRRLPKSQTLSVEDTSALKAQQEFDLVWQAICQYGSRKEPQFCETTAAVVRSLGGWQAICETWKDSERVWKEKEFVRLWQMYEGKEFLLGAGAQGVSTGIALGAPAATAALESPVPAGVCPECRGTGWITAWREGKLTSSAFPCTCNREWNGKHFTREELAADGWFFTEPKRPKRPAYVPRKTERSRFPGLHKDFKERIALMEIAALEDAGQTRLASEKRAALQRLQESVSQAIA